MSNKSLTYQKSGVNIKAADILLNICQRSQKTEKKGQILGI